MNTNTVSIVEILKERARAPKQLPPRKAGDIQIPPYLLALMRMEIVEGRLERR